MKRVLVAATAVAAIGLLAGCASTPASTTAATSASGAPISSSMSEPSGSASSSASPSSSGEATPVASASELNLPANDCEQAQGAYSVALGQASGDASQPSAQKFEKKVTALCGKTASNWLMKMQNVYTKAATAQPTPSLASKAPAVDGASPTATP